MAKVTGWILGVVICIVVPLGLAGGGRLAVLAWKLRTRGADDGRD